MPEKKIVGVILAAGRSSRFGGDKLIYPLSKAESIIQRTVRKLIAVLPETIVVVRPGHTVLVESLLDAGVRIIENPLADQGMGTSLAVAIRASADADGWLVALADMPWIQRQTIHRLFNQLSQGASLVAPEYQGIRGHPVGFSSLWLEDLQSLDSDKGAHKLLENHADQLQLISTQDSGVIRDVDTRDDLIEK